MARFALILWLLMSSVASAKEVSLQGKSFVLTEAEGFQLVSGSSLRLGFFEDPELSFGAGCNGMSGPYELVDGRLVLPGVRRTEKACRAEYARQDQWLHGFMSSKPRITYDEEHLTLEGDDAKLVFLLRELAAPDLPLVGTRWEVNMMTAGGRTAYYRVPSNPTLVFAQDGSVRIDTGCNTGRGRFTKASAKQLRVSAVRLTKTRCTGNQAIVDKHIKALLAGATMRYEIEEAQLKLTVSRALVVYASAH
ncbi:MAG TPA: META domain-containing protein [Polyangiales bacterium]|nr:META domain-containing protein [Polyangiales bacterium]